MTITPASKTIIGINYASSTDSEQELDLYLPAATDFPTAVYVHGGSWTSGTKEMFARVGEFLQANGIGCAVINYRLSPRVVFPAHAEDTAAAFAWVKNNIKSYGGNGKVFLIGHSAGAFLASCLVMESKYLKPYGLTRKDIPGVVAVSGLYLINYNVNFYGVGYVFKGCDKKQVSPFTHIRKGLPPYLLFYAEKDIPTLESQAKNFRDKLAKYGNRVKLCLSKGDHSSVLVHLVTPGNPLEEELLGFIKGN